RGGSDAARAGDGAALKPMRLVRVAGTLVLLLAFVWAGFALAVFVFGHRDEARAADAVVVLGAAQYNGHPSPVLQARLDHAIVLYHKGLAPHLILTGGVGRGDTVSEAEVGKRYAVEHGVPGERVLTERAGLSSDESMHTVARIMDRHDLHSAVLVSDRFHMLRLRILAAQLGIRGFSSPTPTSPILPNSPTEWKHVVRESFIIPYTLLGGG
ncbi:MAG TPA: YdcF family protein, partial [Longimicrobiaceae bacterium]|nr:YdcF family protein [Longimicrobiaceae bacterium]